MQPFRRSSDRVMPAPSTASGNVVVAIDDDVAVLASLKFALEIEGFAVEGYRSGEDLLAVSSPQNPACLIVDLKLPGIDGVDLVTELRARGVGCPAILITTAPPAMARRRAALAGLAIVEKPLLGNTLAEALHAALASGN